VDLGQTEASADNLIDKKMRMLDQCLGTHKTPVWPLLVF